MARTRYASPSKIIEIHQKLEEILTKVDGGVQYPSGYTDIRMGNMLGVSAHTIGRVRKDMFGDLVPKNPKAKSEQVDEFEFRIQKLERQVGDLLSFVESNFQLEFEAVKS